MQQIKKASGRFDEIARLAEARPAGDPPEPNQELARIGQVDIQPQGLGRSVVAGEHARSDAAALVLRKREIRAAFSPHAQRIFT